MGPRLRGDDAGARRANHLSPHALICPPCPVPPEKIFWFSEVQISAIFEAVLSHHEGRWPTSLTRGRMRWTRVALQDEGAFLRTEKSCSPDPSTLVSSSWEAKASSGVTVARKPEH